MANTEYEILVLKSGRWQMDRRYGQTGRHEAVDRAKSLEGQAGNLAVKVIKETDDGLETVIYNSATSRPKTNRPAAAQAPKKASAPKQAPQAAKADPLDDKDSRYRTMEKQAFTAVGKVIVITMMGMIAAVALTWGLSTVINNINMDVLAQRSPNLANLLGGQARSALLLAIFFGTFLLFAGPYTISVIRRAAFERRAAGAPGIGEGMLDRVVGDTKAATLGNASMKAPATAAEIMAMTEPGAQSAEDAENAESAENTESAENAPPAEPTPGIETFDEEWGLTTATEKAAGEEDDQEIEVRGLPPMAQNARAKFMQFFGGSLQDVKEAGIALDSHNRFGCCLYLAGACEILGRDNELDPHFVVSMITELVRMIGIEGDQAVDFGKNYQGYLLNNPRYLNMFDRGREAMMAYLSDDPAKARKELARALEDWAKPKGLDDENATVTVLFTDMVGSTSLTQEQGDLAAQQIVRLHNRIVRDALAQWGGREVKHTGDGIMAAFSSAEQGVRAAMHIQKSTAESNHGDPKLPLRLKIGINAGEPIAEDDDLFGTTVQLAARIVDKASEKQIFVSDTVKGLCAGKDLHFGHRGEFEMKGIEHPVPLFEVLWTNEMEVREAALTPEERAELVAGNQTSADDEQDVGTVNITPAEGAQPGTMTPPAEEGSPITEPAPQAAPDPASVLAEAPAPAPEHTVDKSA